MKKIILSAFLIVVSANAIENWNDIEPNSYQKNNLTVNVIPGTYKQNVKIQNTHVNNFLSPFNGFSIGIYNKISLKENKKTDIFVFGGVDFASYKKDDLLYNNEKLTLNIQRISGNVELCYATNSKNVISSVSLGAIFNRYDFFNDSLNYNTNEYGGYLEESIGINLDILTVGEIIKVSKLHSGNNSIFTKMNSMNFDFKIPIQKNIDKDTAVIVSPEYTYRRILNSSDRTEEYKLTIGLSWLY